MKGYVMKKSAEEQAYIVGKIMGPKYWTLTDVEKEQLAKVQVKESQDSINNMQEVYKAYMLENAKEFSDIEMTMQERRDLGLDMDSEIARYKAGEGAIEEFYADILRFREEILGEDVSMYQRGSTGVRDIAINKGESDSLAITPIVTSNPVDQDGILEAANRRFQEGITCGTSFQDAGRHSYMDEGVDSNQIYDVEEGCMSTIEGELANARARQAYVTQYNSQMDFAKAARQEVRDIATSALPEVLVQLELQVRALKGSYIAAKAAASSIVSSTVSEVMSTATGKWYVKYPYSWAKVVTFETPVVYGSEEMTKGLKKAKSENTIYLSELHAFCRTILEEMYGEELLEREMAFYAIQSLIQEELLTASPKVVGLAIRRGNIKFNRTSMMLALQTAKDFNTEERFAFAEYQTLGFAGLIPKAKSKAKKKNAAATKAIITEETAKLVKAIQNGDTSVVTKDNHAAIMEAAYQGGDYRITPASVYKEVRNMFKAA
jgi:hypothetical protein